MDMLNGNNLVNLQKKEKETCDCLHYKESMTERDDEPARIKADKLYVNKHCEMIYTHYLQTIVNKKMSDKQKYGQGKRAGWKDNSQHQPLQENEIQ